MNDYRHHVSGFFAHRAEAEGALARLVAKGLPASRLQLIDAESLPASTQVREGSNETLTNVLVDGAIGTVVGTGLGALAQVAVVAANISLFIASPLVAPLVMLGWGASLGAFVGAAAGANADIKTKEGWLSDLVRDAIMSGQIVLLAETESEQETAIASEIIGAAVGEYTDVRASTSPAI